MDTTISSLQHTGNSSTSRYKEAIPTQNKRGLSFDRMIAQSINSKKSNAARNQINAEQHPPLFIGRISKSSPTVSQLMMDHEQLGGKSWEIIHSQVNRNKPYTKVSEGTEIFLNTANNELFFGQAEETKKNIVASQTQPVPHACTEGNTKIDLGSLDKNSPTISHLLATSKEFNNEKWQILALPVNAGKDFRHIPEGATVHIDAQTKEISWEDETLTAIAASSPAPFGNEVDGTTTTDNLSAAVKEFIGTPYSKLDCYELVVKGLKNIGVQYGGENGLYRQLTGMAKAKGLPNNAYLTGEGLVEATGSRVLYETFPIVKKPNLAAKKTLDKMSRLLEQGQILSFSTLTRGHTGIISRQPDGEWTFINSGRMDHPVKKAQTKREVGEENLLAELTNWFQLAKRRKESLTITLGKVDLAKIKQPTSSGTLLASI